MLNGCIDCNMGVVLRIEVAENPNTSQEAAPLSAIIPSSRLGPHRCAPDFLSPVKCAVAKRLGRPEQKFCATGTAARFSFAKEASRFAYRVAALNGQTADGCRGGGLDFAKQAGILKQFPQRGGGKKA